MESEHNAVCLNCGAASFPKGYSIRKEKYELVKEGVCDKCGERIARVVD